MHIALEAQELAILSLHMNVTRKTIKKGFKSNYGALEGKKKLRLFDDIKERLVNLLKEEKNLYELEFSEDEFIMLYSFLNWCMNELKHSARTENCRLEKDEQVMFLNSVHQKVMNVVEEEEVS